MPTLDYAPRPPRRRTRWLIFAAVVLAAGIVAVKVWQRTHPPAPAVSPLFY